MIYVVTYVYATDRDAEITELRPRHREFLAGLHEAGHLITSGPWVDGPAGAYLLMRGASADEAVAPLDGDPFYGAGLIAERSVQGWNPVIGSLA